MNSREIGPSLSACSIAYLPRASLSAMGLVRPTSIRIYLEPGGSIGEHQAGFDQLFLIVEGSAWAASEDGKRAALSAGQGAYFATGEIHSKGSDEGATVIMIQVSSITPAARATK